MAGKVAGGVFLTFFLTFWSGITLTMTSLFVGAAWNSMRAESYPTVQGVVIHSDVEVNHGDDATTYGVDVKYRYEVGRRQYIGEQYRYGDMASNDDYAKRIVRSLPVESIVTVYYNPDDPSDAVLKPGVNGADLFAMLFMTPFNLVMLAGWTAVGAGLWNMRKPMRDRVVKIRKRRLLGWASGRIQVELPEGHPLVAAAVTMGILAFASIFIVGFSSGFHPSLTLMNWWWAVLLIIVAAVYLHTRWRVMIGHFDMVLDDHAHLLTLPATMKRKKPVDLRYEQITDVKVDIEKPKSKGSTDSSPKYIPTLSVIDDKGKTVSHPVASWSAHDEAEAMADWLKEKLHL